MRIDGKGEKRRDCREGEGEGRESPKKAVGSLYFSHEFNFQRFLLNCECSKRRRWARRVRPRPLLFLGNAWSAKFYLQKESRAIITELLTVVQLHECMCVYVCIHYLS